MLFVGVIQSQVDLTAGGGVVTFIGVLGILFLTALTASAYGACGRVSVCVAPAR